MRHARTLGIVLMTLLISTAAAADDRPSVASDGFYIGLRFNPDAALSIGWDLDFELGEMISLGPGIQINLLSGGGDHGQDQNFLLAADVLRLKVALYEPRSGYRPYAVFGGGLYWAWMAEEADQRDETQRLIARAMPEEHVFGGLITVGFGLETYFDSDRDDTTRGGFTLTALTHFAVAGSDRVPDVWAELLLGMRFGG